MQNRDCVETDTRNELQRTCPVCSNLFLVKSERDDRRPLVVCGSGDTICVDCYNECRKRTDRTCPTCGDVLLPTPAVNKTLMEMIGNCATLLEISNNDIKTEEKPFASGGLGKVYKAEWRRTDVVIKVIKGDNEEVKQDIKCEANLTLRLKHQNVIKLFGITCVKGKKLGMVMELAEHGSLDKWIGEIDHEKVRKIALGIIDGLKYVHSQHVIHRDIKPQNILMFGPKNDIIPKIADFGVSKVIETVIMTHTRVGQELYMAPEVKMNIKYGFPADIFSLAMMLFEMFNEQLVIQAPDEVKLFILGGRIGRLPKICKVPAYLHNVIERGWLENPEGRSSLDDFYATIHG